MRNVIIKAITLSLVSVVFAVNCFADDEPVKIEPTKPQDGVYVTYTGYMTTVVELRDGRFRYWFESDSKSLREPDYPLKGKYTQQKSKITLHHDQVSQKEWTFRRVGDIVTLWRHDALTIEAKGTSFAEFYPLGMDNFRRCGGGSILVATKRGAEKAWAKHEYAEVTEEQRKKVSRATKAANDKQEDN